MKKYGELPKDLGIIDISCKEMMYYQYLPIKLKGQTKLSVEDRLKCFGDFLGKVCCDFVGEYGLDIFVNSYIYLTAKRLYQSKGCSFNREGYHSDGFLTDDINYIWSDKKPTIFNYSDFGLTLNDKTSLDEMECQANEDKIKCYPNKTILRLNQFNIHRVSDDNKPCIRTFLKVSFSQDKYDLKGNSINYGLKYNWNYRERGKERNIPQNLNKNDYEKPNTKN